MLKVTFKNRKLASKTKLVRNFNCEKYDKFDANTEFRMESNGSLGKVSRVSCTNERKQKKKYYIVFTTRKPRLVAKKIDMQMCQDARVLLGLALQFHFAMSHDYVTLYGLAMSHLSRDHL